MKSDSPIKYTPILSYDAPLPRPPHKPDTLLAQKQTLTTLTLQAKTRTAMMDIDFSNREFNFISPKGRSATFLSGTSAPVGWQADNGACHELFDSWYSSMDHIESTAGPVTGTTELSPFGTQDGSPDTSEACFVNEIKTML